ncbi:MAG: zinc ABC transporter substrate-binding protein [Ruminococcaceae bacterium]|nr:zinc ABC transporter substrate-binding protein [Oscillospiraceae bacterium]
MKKLMCVVLALTLLIFSGCAGNTPKTQEGKITVATSFYPVYIFTLNLLNGIEEVNVECMAEQSAGCLHDYTLTAKDAKLLSDAQVLIINGAGMESFLQDALEGVGNLNVIDSSLNIELICDEEHHHEDEHNEHHHHENSHIWLSVKNAKKQVENIKNGLVKEFPRYKNKIEENYSDYIERLDALQEEQKTVLSGSKALNTISFHGAFEYLALDLGFNISATIESDEGYEPSAKELASLSNKIKNHNIKALFIAPDYSGSSAEILGRETNTEIYVLNPFISGEEELTAYEDIMKDNYRIILKEVK